jgi:hypothetical protein
LPEEIGGAPVVALGEGDTPEIVQCGGLDAAIFAGSGPLQRSREPGFGG